MLTALRTRARTAALRATRPLLAARAQRANPVDGTRWGWATDAEGCWSIGGTTPIDLVDRFGSPVHAVALSHLAHHLAAAADAATAPATTAPALANGATAPPLQMMASHRATHVAGLVGAIDDAGWSMWAASGYEVEAAVNASMPAERIIFAPRALTPAAAASAVAFGVGVICAATPAALDDLAARIAGTHAAADTDGRGDAGVGAASVKSSPPSPPPRLGAAIELDLDDVAASGAIDTSGVSALLSCSTPGNAPVDHLHISATARPVGSNELDGIVDAVGRLVNTVGGKRRLRSLSVSVQLRPASVRPVGTTEARLNQAVALPLSAPTSAEALPASVRRVRDRLAAVGVEGLHISFDPGPAATASSQCTLATVLGVDTSGATNHVVLDAGINLAEDTLTEYHHLVNVSARARDDQGGARDDHGGARDDHGGASGRRGRARLVPYRFVGPICTPADVLYANWWMDDIRAGDVVAVMDTGGGHVAESTTFSFPRPAVVGVEADGSTRVLRRAEEFDDLVALD